MSRLGQLQISVENASYFISQNLPYVVRDATMAFVTEGLAGQKGVEDLPEGYYSVEVMTPSGGSYTELVHVRPESTVEVVVPEEAADTVSPAELATAAPAFGTNPTPQIVETRFCTGYEDGAEWVFLPDPDLEGVPTARFDVGEEHDWIVSLPLNPRGFDDDLRAARVAFQRTGAKSVKPVVSFAGNRRVSKMLDGVLRHHTVAAAGLLDEAAWLLLYKYDDPPGAALGGLTLYRFGRLGERRDWIENLANGFPWLPDGRILWAALLMEEEDAAQRAAGLDLLLRATTTRPLFTDGISLGADLLRRWPDKERADERRKCLAGLSDFTCTTSWDDVMLTTRSGW